MEGGRAITDILLGDEEPGGRLPITLPRDQADLPSIDWDATVVTYPKSWGQRALDENGVRAAYPFGFGLGYTQWSICDVDAGSLTGDEFDVTAEVTNTGERDGRHVVQVYAAPDATAGRTRTLLGFATIRLAAGKTATTTLQCSLRPLQQWDGQDLITPAGPVQIEVPSYWGDPDANETIRRMPISSAALGRPCVQSSTPWHPTEQRKT